MSLLFLTHVLDSFRALDDAGRPLPGAVLTFWRSQTSAPATVYADQELLIELSDAQGRVVADAQGIFPLIYLDPDTLYRVRLQTGEGVLRWDVDPYLCDCTDPPRLFRNPLHQTLTRIEGLIPRFEPPPVPGARLIFTDYNTGAPARVWADAARTVPLRNPLPSNAAGIFPPVYLEDGIEYRVQLVAPDGSVLLDVDPYECQCGFLLLTSKAYAYEFEHHSVGSGGAIHRGIYDPVFGHVAAGSGGSILVGALMEPIIPYHDWPPDVAIGVGGAILGGDLDLPPDPTLPYENWPPDEAVGTGGLINSGTMIAPVVEYENWPSDIANASGGSINSGTLN